MNESGDAKAEAKAAKARAKAQRPWWKKKRWIGAGVVVLLIIAMAASGGGDGGDADLASDADDEAGADSDGDGDQSGGDGQQQRASIGEPATDGQFTFTVMEPLDCGHATIGEEPMQEEAQGQWCILTAEVENTGDEARSLSASAQLLYDTQDREFEASSPMGVDSPFLEQINPGNSVEGRFFFDVPDDFKAAHVELHDSALSSGVQVDLSE